MRSSSLPPSKPPRYSIAITVGSLLSQLEKVEAAERMLASRLESLEKWSTPAEEANLDREFQRRVQDMWRPVEQAQREVTKERVAAELEWKHIRERSEELDREIACFRLEQARFLRGHTRADLQRRQELLFNKSQYREQSAAPSAPTELRCTFVTANSLVLSWTAGN